MGDPTSSYATARIVLRVSGALKPHHQDKVETPLVGDKIYTVLVPPQILVTSAHHTANRGTGWTDNDAIIIPLMFCTKSAQKKATSIETRISRSPSAIYT
jgi:hypothetical protein